MTSAHPRAYLWVPVPLIHQRALAALNDQKTSHSTNDLPLLIPQGPTTGTLHCNFIINDNNIMMCEEKKATLMRGF